MTPRDAISDLVHRYSDGVTRRDVAQWTSCWADDARWSISADRTAVGREEIVALLAHALASLEGVVQNVLHGSVTIDGRTAAGRWHIVEYQRRVGGESRLLLAHYDDTYVERQGCWQFASRTLVRSYEGPPDLSGMFTKEPT